MYFHSNFDNSRWLRQGANNSKIVFDIAETQVGEWGVPESEEHGLFVGAVLNRAGLPTSGSLDSKSYRDYGVEVEIEKARKGDIVVLESGYVGFFQTTDDRRVWVLGNYEGRIDIKSHDLEDILALRRVQ